MSIRAGNRRGSRVGDILGNFLLWVNYSDHTNISHYSGSDHTHISPKFRKTQVCGYRAATDHKKCQPQLATHVTPELWMAEKCIPEVGLLLFIGCKLFNTYSNSDPEILDYDDKECWFNNYKSKHLGSLRSVFRFASWSILFNITCYRYSEWEALGSVTGMWGGQCASLR